MTIIDFLFILAVTFLSEYVRALVSRHNIHSLGPPEFDIGRNTLYIIYSQMLIWLGTFYSPLLSLIMIPSSSSSSTLSG